MTLWTRVRRSSASSGDTAVSRGRAGAPGGAWGVPVIVTASPCRRAVGAPPWSSSAAAPPDAASGFEPRWAGALRHLATRAPVLWAGVALGLAALLEIPALLLTGRLLARTSAWSLVAAGCVSGVAYYGLVALVPDPVVYVAAQPLNAVFFAVVAGVGLTVFQDTFPAPGLASGLFTNTRRIGAVLSGLLITAVAPAADSYRMVFVASAAIVAVVLAGVVLARRRSAPSASARS